MAAEISADGQLEIGHVLFMDIVGYAKLSIEEQRQRQEQLKGVVRDSRQFQGAEVEGKLVRLPTSDGMALVFFNSGEAPIRCAAEITQALKDHPQLQLRMGVHTGRISTVTDVNDRSNIAGAGINIAQRVMDIGDAGHILLSKRGAEDLSQSRQWQPHLHDLGQFEAKHGVKIDIVNYYTDSLGNPRIPEKLAANRKKLGRRKRLLIVAAVLFVLAIPITMSIFLRRPASGLAVMLLEKSIAVLPFENFTDNKESAYFADGVQDDILTDLAKVADLKVISRRSVAQYRGGTQNVREIGKALQVAHVLEGTVRRIGDKIRVTAQLIDTRTETQTWADKYERDIADVFAVQSEISQAIIGRLKASLSPAEKTRIETAPTRDMVAYDLYLRGKELIFNAPSSRDPAAEIDKGIDLLNQAVARDPSFALAYSLLSQTHVHLFRHGDPTPENLEKARTYAESALRLAPELGEAHLAEARYFYEGVQDFQRALPEFTRAQEALPNNADVQTWMGNLKRRMGNWAEAVQHQRKAMELDPHNPWALDLIVTFRLLRNYDEAERTIDRAQIGLPQLTNQFRGSKALIALCKGDLKGCKIVLQSLPPDEHQGFAPYVRARFALFERNYDEADQILNACTQATDFERQWVARDKAFVARARGDAAKTRDAFQAARKTFENELQSRPNDPQLLSIAAVYDAGLGRKEEALRESQKAIDLFPKGGDATDGPEFLRRQALVFAWAGERDRALQLLSDLVRRPGPLSPGELKFDPGWDDLRQDPRFAEVVAACERPAKIDNH